MNPLPKLCGADVELGNFILGLNTHGNTCYLASRALLQEIRGISRSAFTDIGRNEDSRDNRDGDGWGSNSQDWGRNFLPGNGGCAYVDLNHLELCQPEVISAYDHVAAWQAMLRIAAEALQSANTKLRGEVTIQVLVNNSDGHGHSYGSHLNFLVSRRTWENIFNRKPHHMLYLASFQASSIVYTGQGKVGSENGTAPADFQISQRADFFEQLTGAQTTYNRPIVNSRDESLCGTPRYSRETTADKMARLHVIFFDNTLCEIASLLKVGVMQIVLSMIEYERINPTLLLDDPLEALLTWSHDPSLQKKARMASGQALTAVELQLLFLEEAMRFLDSGECEKWVPRAPEIVSLWEDTLRKLQRRDFSSLAPRLDWVLKLTILQRAMERGGRLGWDSPRLKHLDQLYSSLDPSEGLFWAYRRDGFTERIVDEARIERFVHDPPEDTRAWTRAMILRRTAPGSVDSVDWDSIRIKTRRRGVWSRYTELDMPNPLGFTRENSAHVFKDGMPLEDILERLASEQSEIS